MATQAIEGQPTPSPFIGLVPLLRQWLLKANALQLPEKIRHFVIRWIIGYRSPAEKLQMQHQKMQRMEAEKECDDWFAEAEKFARTIRETYTRHGVCYRYKKSEKSALESIQEVEFSRPFQVEKEVVKLKVDTLHLPRGIGIKDLENDDIKRLLTINCDHQITTYAEDGCGYWIWVQREEGYGGIPRHVAFSEMINSRPPNLAGERLAFPVGIGKNKKFIWRILPKCINLLIAGSPDSGKSNAMNAIICTLLKYNQAYQFKLCLIDLKGGVELQFYSELYDYLLKIPKPKIKKKAKEVFKAARIENGQEEVSDDIEVEEGDEASHETVPAYFDRREYVPAVLSWLIKEVDRRLELFANDHVKKIQTYNQHHPDHMLPYVAVCFDEWADVRLERAFGAKCEDLLINISNRARASGIHVILCTQTPTKEVLTRRVMNAMNSRFVLFCVDKYMSDILLNSYDAANLDPKLHGRGFWVSGSDRMEVQSPLITDDMVDRIVADAKGGNVTEMEPIKRHDISEMDILKWAQDKNEGKLGWRDIYAEFRKRNLPQQEAETFCRPRLNKEFEIDNKKYILVAPSGWGKKRKPYRLLPIT